MTLLLFHLINVTLQFYLRTKKKTEHSKNMYEINCLACDSIYIRQCGRELKTRISEHINSTYKNIIHTGFTKYCLTRCHFIETNNVKVLHNIEKEKSIDLL